MRKTWAIILTLAFVASAAAQQGFFPQKRIADIIATPVSQTVPFALASGISVETAWVCNMGQALVYVAFGTASITADPALASPIMPAHCETFQTAGALYMAAVTQAGEIDTPLIQTVIGSGRP